MNSGSLEEGMFNFWNFLGIWRLAEKPYNKHAICFSFSARRIRVGDII